MPAPAPTDRLRAIKRLDQLLAYLREELDWPVGDLSAEDVTFDYDPEELGVPREAKVGFREIKQLRPLAAGQPWGVFWVSFEKKKLPVVLLRRVLRELSIRRRPDPTKAARTAWQPEDLLFISSYGDTDDAREISVAHFALDPAHPAELPVLRVLDWDAHDTALKLRHLDRTLHDYPRRNGRLSRRIRPTGTSISRASSARRTPRSRRSPTPTARSGSTRLAPPVLPACRSRSGISMSAATRSARSG